MPRFLLAAALLISGTYAAAHAPAANPTESRQHAVKVQVSASDKRPQATKTSATSAQTLSSMTSAREPANDPSFAWNGYGVVLATLGLIGTIAVRRNRSDTR